MGQGEYRKNYFYPDNPQNYQISQLYLPICRNGGVEIETEQGGRKVVGIHEIFEVMFVENVDPEQYVEEKGRPWSGKSDAEGAAVESCYKN